MLKITFINVGYGEGILIESGEGAARQTILIDGGSGEDEEYSQGQGRIRAKDYLAQKGIAALDCAIVTHAHEDHVCALEDFVAAGGIIKKLLTVCVLPKNAARLPVLDGMDSGTRKFVNALNSYGRLLALMQKQNIDIVEIDGSATEIPLAPDLAARVIAPSIERAQKLFARFEGVYQSADSPAFVTTAGALAADLNGYSLAMMLLYKGKKIFLPADAVPQSLAGDAGFENALKTGALKADCVKLAHHGQRDGITQPFIQAASPEIVITCGSSDRRYESSHPDVYARIAQWLPSKPVFLFTDAVPIDANTLCRAPHSATVIAVSGSGEISYAIE